MVKKLWIASSEARQNCLTEMERNFLFRNTFSQLSSQNTTQSMTFEDILPPSSKQLLTVIAQDWNSQTAKVQAYQKEGDCFYPIFSSMQAAIGKNGLAWGRSSFFQPRCLQNEFMKKEGDKKSPAGLFRILSSFGFLPAFETSHLLLPYLEIQDSMEAIDDVDSKFYNQIVDRRLLQEGEIDWKSSEKMNDLKKPYYLGLVIDFNSSPIIPGEGSCIFIHCSGEDLAPTDGCTALVKQDIHILINWLDARQKPYLLQLTSHFFSKTTSLSLTRN